MKIRASTNFGQGFYAFSLETEPPPEGGPNATFFTISAGPYGGEVTLYLRAEDIRALYRALGDHLFNVEREIQT